MPDRTYIMASKRFTRDEIDNYAQHLRDILTPGYTVSTKVLHVSRSGMSREIGAYIVQDGQIRDISLMVAAITGNRYGNNGGVAIPGTGMDMAFALVYSLSRSLYPQGHRCTGSNGYTPSGKRSSVPRCPSNDHSNDYSRLAREFDASPAGQILDAECVAALRHGTADQEQAARTAYVAARQEWIAAQKTYSRSRHHSDGGYALVKASL